MARRPGRLIPPALPPSPVVLLLVDFINPLNFPGADRLAPAATEAARATRALRRRVSASGVRSVYVNDHYGDWRMDLPALWRRCSQGTGAAAEMARALKPTARDFTILKPRHSGFHATPLDLLLRDLKCQRLIVTGLATDSCVLFTAMEAYQRGYALWVPQDCVAAESARATRQALDQMARVLKAETRASHD